MSNMPDIINEKKTYQSAVKQNFAIVFEHLLLIRQLEALRKSLQHMQQASLAWVVWCKGCFVANKRFLIRDVGTMPNARGTTSQLNNYAVENVEIESSATKSYHM